MPGSPTVPYDIPPLGSLGLLAAGHRGLTAWREARGTAWKDALPTRAAAQHAVDPALASATLAVVSGLPRSGTSMLMQMVTAGGLPAFTDQRREADASNPRGYFEHEQVKRLMLDRSWVPDADGHVVKVVAPLLPYLPAGPTYRVVMVERDLDQVLRSQAAMLGRSVASGDAALTAAYRRYLAAALRWAESHADVLRLDHADVVARPLDAARRLREFLGLDAAPEAVAAVVDPSLHRQTPDA